MIRANRGGGGDQRPINTENGEKGQIKLTFRKLISGLRHGTSPDNNAPALVALYKHDKQQVCGNRARRWDDALFIDISAPTTTEALQYRLWGSTHENCFWGTAAGATTPGLLALSWLAIVSCFASLHGSTRTWHWRRRFKILLFVPCTLAPSRWRIRVGGTKEESMKWRQF